MHSPCWSRAGWPILIGLLVNVATANADQLAPLLVTATRTAISADASLAPVTVLTRADIERSQASSVAELLGGTPGVQFSNNGGLGKLTSIFLRGSESDHLLVLVDGVKIGSATTGAAALHDLSPALIDRIEIVRGPRSSLYGSEAIGGVIQIFTRQGQGRFRPAASIAYGSDRTGEVSLGIAGGMDLGTAGAGGLSVNLDARSSDGINACRASFVAGCFTDEPDLDGYASAGHTLQAWWEPGDATRLDLNWLRSDAESDFDGGFQNRENTRQEVLGARLHQALSDALELTLALGRARDESDNYLNQDWSSRFTTRRDTALTQLDWALDDASLWTLGAEYAEEQVGGSTPYARDRRDNRAVFGQLQQQFGGHDLLLALRQDDNEQFGNHLTGSVSWGLTLTPALRLIGSWGSAFKAPSFNELYYPWFGNPKLDPETSDTWELALQGTSDALSWGLNLFQTEVDDLISFDAELFLPNNIERARIWGLELNLTADWRDWRIGASGGWLDARNQGGGFHQGNRLPRRARWNAALDLDRDFNDWSTGVSLRLVGDSYDDLANSRPLDGYALLDLRAEYRFSDALRLQGRVANLMDEDYETAAFYNQPGRQFLVTLRYQP